ncbi:MAG: hypothetical protein GY946_28570 [bacterium]|nr:hypothetical protein [bacterium]
MGIVPGGPLAGTLVGSPIADWSFTDEHATIAIETRGSWIDHSVTVLCTAQGGNLYIPSRHAPNKRWVQNILGDPHVRIGVDDRIYPARAIRVTDPGEAEAAARAQLRKYLGLEAETVRPLHGPPEPGDDRAEVWMFRIESLPAGDSS